MKTAATDAGITTRLLGTTSALATQATGILLGLDDVRDRVVRRYGALVDEANEEVNRLIAAGRP